MRSGSKVSLSETALRIYLLLIREDKPMSIREIQRALGLSSPGQVYHHLERLRPLVSLSGILMDIGLLEGMGLLRVQ
ncbi:helix-turn-helix domain-containing protein [Vulcanisaeta sp. JCM 16159]|uniref:helix-turn-helix domain-containing protein n=1 Tax=Vulcanisaeta sp. JCM 16159 TaxID=1295371 RepID=UPI0006D0C274|nr:helix-turn-helix domain-containing protein [Vulcanisaeta sp. JCM 16159]